MKLTKRTRIIIDIIFTAANVAAAIIYFHFTGNVIAPSFNMFAAGIGAAIMVDDILS